MVTSIRPNHSASTGIDPEVMNRPLEERLEMILKDLSPQEKAILADLISDLKGQPFHYRLVVANDKSPGDGSVSTLRKNLMSSQWRAATIETILETDPDMLMDRLSPATEEIVKYVEGVFRPTSNPYTIQTGDALGRTAKRFGASLSSLAAQHNISKK